MSSSNKWSHTDSTRVNFQGMNLPKANGPIKRLLIANRGEIARRLIEVCHHLGITSVAVYCDHDAQASHVEAADEAIHLGSGTVLETYRNPDCIAAAAEQAQADAVHPGYGFLSESAEAARQVTDAGIIWLGPNPKILELFGDKSKSREVAEKAGLRVIPGTPEWVDLEAATAFFNEHGSCVLKWTHGGGGRGIHMVRTADELGSEFEKAQGVIEREGVGGLIAEMLLDDTRHIELQFLADQHGNVVVLGTRDCTVQRRNQKLIEEASASTLTAEERDFLYEGVKNLARAVGYVGVGTVEFLMHTNGSCYFLEVNPRIQVEHTVTEETTGICIPAQQVRVAGGEALGFDDPEVKGHALELRINAERPPRFLPSAGQLSVLNAAFSDIPGVRFDAAYVEGEAVTPNFDSLLAKLIVYGQNREEAIDRALLALEALEIEGVKTTTSVASAILGHDDFRADRHRSQWFGGVLAGEQGYRI